MNRALALAPVAALTMLAAVRAVRGQDAKPADAKPADAKVTVRYDLGSIAEPLAESAGVVVLPGEEKDEDETGFSFASRHPASDLGDQLVAAIASTVRPGSWEDEDLAVHGDVGAHADLPAVGSFAPDSDTTLVVKREPAAQADVKALLDSWTRYRRLRVQLEVELFHVPAETMPPALKGAALPDATALAALRSSSERVVGVSRMLPLGVRRLVHETRQRTAKPFVENVPVEPDVQEPLLVEAVAEPLPSGRFQLTLHVACGQWSDAERVLVARRFVVVSELASDAREAIARLDDERGCDLLVARVTPLAAPAAVEPYAFYDVGPLLESDDDATADPGGDPARGEPVRSARALLRAVNAKLAQKAVRVGSLFIVPAQGRAALLEALAAWERPASVLDALVLATDPAHAPDEPSLAPAKARALAGASQVLERFAARTLEGAPAFGRRLATAWNAAGERQENPIARSHALVAVLRDGEARLDLATQSSATAGRLPLSQIPVKTSTRLESERYLVTQQVSREGRTTAVLVGSLDASARTKEPK